MHIALAQVVAGDDAALEMRAGQIEALAREGRYPSGAFVPAVARGFAAFEGRDFEGAIDALGPVADDLERIGGSHAQLDLVRFTLLKAYLGADRTDDAQRMLNVRRPRAAAVPVVGLAFWADAVGQPRPGAMNSQGAYSWVMSVITSISVGELAGDRLAQCGAQAVCIRYPPGGNAEALGIHLEIGIAQLGAGIATLEQAALITQHVAVG